MTKYGHFVLVLALFGCSRSEPANARPEPSANLPSEKAELPSPPSSAPNTNPPAPPEPAAPTPSMAQPVASETPRRSPLLPEARKPQALASASGPSAAASSVNAPAVVTGTPAASEAFSAQLQARRSYRRDQPSSVEAVLVAKDPFHCNEKYPYKFTLDPAPSGIKYDAAVVRGMSISPKRSTMTIPFVATQAGTSQIAGELAFSVCTESKCLMEKRRLSVRVTVE